MPAAFARLPHGSRDFRVAQSRPGRLEIFGRQVCNLDGPGLEVQGEHPVYQRMECRFPRAGRFAQRGREPIHAQVREALHPRGLYIAHPGRFDGRVERFVPLDACAQLRSRGQADSPERIDAGAAGQHEHQQGAGERTRQFPGRAHFWAGSFARRSASRRSISRTIPMNWSSMRMRMTTSPMSGGRDTSGMMVPTQRNTILPPFGSGST